HEIPDGHCLVTCKGKPINRTEPQCTLGPVDRALRLAGVGEENAAKKEREGGRWAERKCPLECLTGGNAVMLHQPDDERAQRQRRCVVATMGDRSASMAYGRDAVSLVKSGSEEQELAIAPGEKAVRASIVGLQCQRLFKERHRLGCLFRQGNIDMRNGAQNKV